jgi:hypothetical protein
MPCGWCPNGFARLRKAREPGTDDPEHPGTMVAMIDDAFDARAALDRMGAPDVLTYRVTTRSDGVHRAACSRTCANRLLLSLSAIRPDAELLDADLRPTATCALCCWCGLLTHKVEYCVVHGDHCPPWDWTGTEAARRAVPRLLAETRTYELSPRAWALFGDLCGELAVADQLTSDRLVTGMLNVRQFWAA